MDMSFIPPARYLGHKNTNHHLVPSDLKCWNLTYCCIKSEMHCMAYLFFCELWHHLHTWKMGNACETNS